MQWFRRGCGVGEARSCYMVGFECSERAAASKDLAPKAAAVRCATDAYGKACDGKYPAACVDLATGIVRGKLGAADKVVAAEFFRKACALGASAYCAPPAGQAVPRSRRQQLDASCATGDLPRSAYAFAASRITAQGTAFTLGCAPPEVAVGGLDNAVMGDVSNMGPLDRGRSIWCCP